MEEIRGRRGQTSPGEERGNETGKKAVIAHGSSVEFCEATPIGLADESKESWYGRETDRVLRNAELRDFYLFFSERAESGGGGGAARVFFLLFFPPVQQTTSERD